MKASLSTMFDKDKANILGLIRRVCMKGLGIREEELVKMAR